jgi:hypothetical protein
MRFMFVASLTRARHYPGPDQSSPCSHPTSLRSIIMLSSHLCQGLPDGIFYLAFPTKTLYAHFLSSSCYPVSLIPYFQCVLSCALRLLSVVLSHRMLLDIKVRFHYLTVKGIFVMKIISNVSSEKWWSSVRKLTPSDLDTSIHILVYSSKACKSYLRSCLGSGG